MLFRQIPVRNELKQLVNSILQIELHAADFLFQNLPSSNLNLVFNYKDNAIEKSGNQESLAVRISLEGFRNTPVQYKPLGEIGLVIVTLKPFSKSLLKDLEGDFAVRNNWDLEDIYYSHTKNVEEQLGNSKNPDEIIRHVEYYLLKIFSNTSPDVYASAAINFVRDTFGQISINDLSHKIGYSRKQLERIFMKHIGIKPKKYAQIIQFQHSLQLIQKPQMTLTEAALAAGFFDQAHFNNSFKLFTGKTPVAFVNFLSELRKKEKRALERTYGSHFLIPSE